MMQINWKTVNVNESTVAVYTDSHAEGAIKNGTTIMKTNSKDGDRHEDGWLGVVIGSVQNPEGNNIDPEKDVKYLYWVKWSAMDYPVGIVDYRIKEVKS